MLIDLHTHTKVYSACSALTPEALVRAARGRGVDGVCITEHDALWTPAEVERVAEEMEFLVLRGMEVTTEVGHVLVFGLDAHHHSMAALDELHRIVRAGGGLMYLAHPSRRYGSLPPDDLASMFDSVEVENGTEGLLQNQNAAQMALRLPRPGIGGSDCHGVREVGTCVTEFNAAISDESTFMRALRSGGYRARRL